MTIETIWTDHKDYMNAHIIDPAMRDCLRDLSRCFTDGALNSAMYRIATNLHPMFCRLFKFRTMSLRKIYRKKSRARVIAYYTMAYQLDYFDHIAIKNSFNIKSMYGKSPLLDQVLTWHLHHNAPLATGSVAIEGGNPMLFRGAAELPLTIIK